MDKIDKIDICFLSKFGTTYEELEELRAIKKFYKVNNVQHIFNLDYTNKVLFGECI